MNDWGGVPGKANQGPDPRHHFTLVKGLGHVVIRAAGESLDLRFKPSDDPNKTMIGVLILASRRARIHVHAAHIRQIQVEQDEIIVVESCRDRYPPPRILFYRR